MLYLAQILVLIFLPFSTLAMTDNDCMAEAMYFEARGEGWRGMLAVGVVVRNRVRDPRYPGTVCAVVHQRARNRVCAFSYYCDGLPERADDQQLWRLAVRMADAVISTESLTIDGVADATHYHASYITPYWAPSLTRNGRIGNHIFYTWER